MDNELPEDYGALKGQLRAALMPGNAIASELVEEIAACLWRLKRSRRIEAGLLSNQVLDLERLHHLYGDGSCHGTGPATERRIATLERKQYEALPMLGRAFAKTSDDLTKLSRYETTLRQALERALERLQDL